MSVRTRVFWGVFISTLAFGAIWLMVYLVYNGTILLNNPSRDDFPIRGVDVSHYQGEIDWSVLSENDIEFAYIKATEGSTYVDDCFEYNFNSALDTDLFVGAYHFFSFESDGILQAEHFIRNVPKTEGMLPPVIDVEFYADIKKNPPKDISEDLNAMIEILYKHYGVQPVIYTTQEVYKLYISDCYPEQDIWIRDVIMTPYLPDGRQWTFWQYTNREVLPGYNGEEKFIDMNVFCGSKEDFESFLAKNCVK
ncbi:MAG: glycoside hydrolase family 25 protein [Clostridia bacterium]|nr:glycoside hydrolase family 25 protein [Clostridia bacterium]